MSVEVDPPYRAPRRGPGVYHTDPDCRNGKRIKNPVPYTGNEHDMELCDYCSGKRT